MTELKPVHRRSLQGPMICCYYFERSLVSDAVGTILKYSRGDVYVLIVMSFRNGSLCFYITYIPVHHVSEIVCIQRVDKNGQFKILLTLINMTFLKNSLRKYIMHRPSFHLVLFRWHMFSWNRTKFDFTYGSEVWIFSKTRIKIILLYFVLNFIELFTN